MLLGDRVQRGVKGWSMKTRGLEEVLAERDRLQHELDSLRTHLCAALGLLTHEPGPEGLEAVVLADDKAILAALQKLNVDIAPTTGCEEHRWTRIDPMVLEGHRIEAIQQIRAEFGGGIYEALDMLERRYNRLRVERADEFTEHADVYWDGFYC